MTIYLTLEKLGIAPLFGTAEITERIRNNLKGDAKLWHDLNCNHLRWLASLKGDLRSTNKQLAIIEDQTQHDRPLDEDVFVHIAFAGDGVHASLKAAVFACEQSVTCLQASYDLLSGLFKGEMRDITEESLARSLKGAKAQLEKLKKAEADYSLPRRPHEIRRTALSFLIVSTTKILEELQVLITDIRDDASSDLKLEVEGCAAQLIEFKANLELLRERSSRRLEESLSQASENLQDIIKQLEKIASEAGKRAGRKRHTEN